MKKKLNALIMAGVVGVGFMLSGCSGERGPAGKNGSTWFSGTRNPLASEGVNGDFYLDTDDYILYKKSDEGWEVILKDFGKAGEKGDSGTSGTSWVSGSGAPSTASGNNGDFYLDTTNYVLYKKVSGLWSIIVEEFGKPGEDATGLPGDDGTIWYTNTVAPSASIGVDGDFYYDTDEYVLYKKISGQWVTLIENFGKPGQNGTSGPVYTHDQLAITDKIYGFSGQTLQLYFENICAYDKTSVYFKVISNGNKGKIYGDRWEYTPSSAEEFDLTIQVYSLDFTLLFEKTLKVIIKNESTKQEVNVLVIGDSTVQGNNARELAKMAGLDASDNNFKINFIGTQGGTGEIPKHEGRSGWSAKKFANDATGWLNNVEVANPFYNFGFDFEHYMETNSFSSVDVVFIQLGLNDILKKNASEIDSAVSTYISSIKTMVDGIKSYNSNIKIIINPIIRPQQNPDEFNKTYGSQLTVWEANRNIYQANIGLISNFSTTNNVYLSWYNASIDCYDEQGTNIHPIDAGYDKLGTQMYYYLKAII